MRHEKKLLMREFAKVGLLPGINGFKVTNVKADSIGEKIGFKKNDLILSINGKPLNTFESKHNN